MRVVIVFFILLISLISLLLGVYLSTRYASAFEADQDCHFDLVKNYSQNSGAGCDHDLETRQWLLFEKKSTSGPAEVLKRYRY